MWDKVAISDFRLIYLKMGPTGFPETSVRKYQCVISQNRAGLTYFAAEA
jgi:hypothetical protein